MSVSPHTELLGMEPTCWPFSILSCVCLVFPSWGTPGPLPVSLGKTEGLSPMLL